MKRHTHLALAAALFITAGLLLARVSASAAPRELKIVITDMAFQIEGQGERNPELKFKAGETVRVTLVNEDEGVRHNFWIREWNVGTRLVRGKGETTLEFTVPETKQETQYVCTPHRNKMVGKVVVE
jgi:plastocyanin